MFNAKRNTSAAEYRKEFWNALKGGHNYTDTLVSGKDEGSGGFILPDDFQEKLDGMLTEKSIFRNHATTLISYNGPSHILAKDSDDIAMFVPENGEIPITDGMNDFTQFPVNAHKLAVGLKLDTAFIHDATFNMEDYLGSRLARNFAKAEDNGFINGGGVYEPTGILHPENGAECTVTADSITFDDAIKLYYSLDPEYLANAVWLMNGDTAYKLRTLKDDTGNYLWNVYNDTILGKPVVISEYMPSAESRKMPVVFGDLSYYWIVRRSPFSVTALTELFLMNDQIGYLAFEYLDGRLVRREAVKGIKIGSAAE